MNQESQRSLTSYSQVDKELQKLQKSTRRWQWGLIILTLINILALAWVFDVDKLILNNELISEKIPVISAPSDSIKKKPEESGGMPFKNKDSPIWLESNNKNVITDNKEKLIDSNTENKDSEDVDVSSKINEEVFDKKNTNKETEETQNIPSEILSVLNANRTGADVRPPDSNEFNNKVLNIENEIGDNTTIEANSDANVENTNSLIEQTSEVNSELPNQNIQINELESDKVDEKKELSNDEILRESPNNVTTIKKDINLVIQLASLKSNILAETEWKRLKKIYPELMKNLKPLISEVTIKDKGTFYRLQSFIPKSITNPKDLCDLFKQAGQSCILINTSL